MNLKMQLVNFRNYLKKTIRRKVKKRKKKEFKKNNKDKPFKAIFSSTTSLKKNRQHKKVESVETKEKNMTQIFNISPTINHSTET